MHADSCIDQEHLEAQHVTEAAYVVSIESGILRQELKSLSLPDLLVCEGNTETKCGETIELLKAARTPSGAAGDGDMSGPGHRENTSDGVMTAQVRGLDDNDGAAAPLAESGAAAVGRGERHSANSLSPPGQQNKHFDVEKTATAPPVVTVGGRTPEKYYPVVVAKCTVGGRRKGGGALPSAGETGETQQVKSRDQAKRLALEVARLRSALRGTTSDLEADRATRARLEVFHCLKLFVARSLLKVDQRRFPSRLFPWCYLFV